MKTSRLEAFSDGVLAIIITIMVLEFEVPEETDFKSLLPHLPMFFGYVASFVYVGIYWNNHHHLFQVTEKVNGKILWANLHLLFWLSLLPFTTAWIGKSHLSSTAITSYGVVLFMCGLAFQILYRSIIKFHGEDFVLKKIIRKNIKTKMSLLIYALGIGLSFVYPNLAIACYVLVALFWFIPDKRLESIF